MEANSKDSIPQVGTAAGLPCGESHTEPSSVSPTVSGGGNYRFTGGGVDNFDTENEKQDKLEQLINPFARRDSIRRTPPSTGKLKNPQSLEENQPQDTEEVKSTNINETPPSEDRPKKRKKLSSPIDILQLVDIQPSVELTKLKARTDELNAFTRGNKNVHKEVKRFAMEITSLVKQVIRRHKHDTYKVQELEKELQDYRETQEKRYAKLENELQELRISYEKRFKEIEKNGGDKDHNCDKRSVADDKFNLSKSKINNFEEFIKVVNLGWSEDSFKNVQIDHGDPFNDTSENVVYFCDESTERQTRMGKRILNRHPELAEGAKVVCNGGSYINLKQQTIYKISEGDHTKEKYITAFFYDPTKEEDQVQRDVFHQCQELRKMSEHYDKREVTVVAPQAIRPGNMKKILGTTFQESEVKVTLRTKKKKHDYKEYKERSKNKDDNNIIIIEDKAGTYAETVKKLKESLKGSDALEHIKGVRKTNSGKILVEVSETENKEKVINRLRDNCKIAIFNKVKRKFLHIKDVDATAEAEDIKEAILNTNLIIHQEQLEIKALRPMKNGNQIATIWMEESDCVRIMNVEKLRVGLNICQLQERIEILRCYRCWAYDHKATQCKGEDRSQKCRKCAGDGHKAKDCNDELFCPHCEERGHSAGSGTCRAFQKALRMARRDSGRRNNNFSRSQSSK